MRGFEPAADSLGQGLAHVELRTYKHLACQFEPELLHAHPTGDLGVRLLGVKGAVLARDPLGRRHVALARRHPDTRVYPGMWEIAPGGGIHPSPVAVPAPTSLPPPTVADLLSTLREELLDELGLDWDQAIDAAAPLALLDDQQACSVDVVFALTFRATIGRLRPGVPHAPPQVVGLDASLCQSGRCSWEVIDLAWLAQHEAQAFADRHAHALTPPTRRVLELLGWISAG